MDFSDWSENNLKLGKLNVLLYDFKEFISY